VYLSSSYKDDSKYQKVLFDSIYPNRQTLHGKKIKLSGYLTARFEDFAVYASLKDAKKYNYSKAIWLQIDPYEKRSIDEVEKYIKLNGMFFIEVEGILDMSRMGHMNQYIGTILVKKVVSNELK